MCCTNTGEESCTSGDLIGKVGPREAVRAKGCLTGLSSNGAVSVLGVGLGFSGSGEVSLSNNGQPPSLVVDAYRFAEDKTVSVWTIPTNNRVMPEMVIDWSSLALWTVPKVDVRCNIAVEILGATVGVISSALLPWQSSYLVEDFPRHIFTRNPFFNSCWHFQANGCLAIGSLALKHLLALIEKGRKWAKWTFYHCPVAGLSSATPETRNLPPSKFLQVQAFRILGKFHRREIAWSRRIQNAHCSLAPSTRYPICRIRELDLWDVLSFRHLSFCCIGSAREAAMFWDWTYGWLFVGVYFATPSTLSINRLRTQTGDTIPQIRLCRSLHCCILGHPILHPSEDAVAPVSVIILNRCPDV